MVQTVTVGPVDIAVLSSILVIGMLGIRAEIKDIKSGHRCACIGDCGKCRIKCRSSEKYYGLKHN